MRASLGAVVGVMLAAAVFVQGGAAATVDGQAYKDGATDHSGITLVLEGDPEAPAVGAAGLLLLLAGLGLLVSRKRTRTAVIPMVLCLAAGLGCLVHAAFLDTTGTNSLGEYGFVDVPPGEYSLDASAPGYHLEQIPSLTVTAGANLVPPITLYPMGTATPTPTYPPTSTPTTTPTASPSPTITYLPFLSEIVIGTEANTGTNLLFWRLYPDGSFSPDHLDAHVDGSVERIRIGNFMWNDPAYGDGNSTPESNPGGWWDAMVMTNGVDELGTPVPAFTLWRNNSYSGALAPASSMYEQVLDNADDPPLPIWVDPAVDPIVDFDVADLDGDGDLEMVAAAGTTIMLYDLVWNSVLGQMEFVELSCPNWAFLPDPSPGAPDINGVGLVQADGDGTWDLAVCSLASFTVEEKVHIYTNITGDGCYDPSSIYWSSFTEMRKQVNEVRGGWIYLEPGTVQQDLALGEAAGTLVLAENTLTTYDEHNFSVPPNITALEFFDLYGTSHQELIVLTRSESFRNLYFFRNDPLEPVDPVQNWPGEHFLYPSGGISLSAVAVGYLDFDQFAPWPHGWPDLLLGALNGYVYVELHEGSGTPPFSTPYEFRYNVGAPVTQVRISRGMDATLFP